MVMIEDSGTMEKRIVVTGGAGFIGSHLVDALVERNHSVTIVDNFSRGCHENIEAAIATTLVTVRQVNLEIQKPAIPPGTDVVFHLAAKVTGIEYNRGHHYDMLMTNLAINTNVIEAVKAARPELFVYVSTACVYPHDAPVPTPEEAGDVGNPEPTNHGYGVAKWVGEQMVRHLHREHGIPCIIVRFFNAIGPRDYYDEASSHVTPALIKRVVDGENPVTVWGTGDQTRVFVDARDIAKALGLLMDMARGRDTYGPWIVNIGHDREISIGQLAREIISQSRRDIVDIEYDISKPDGYPRRAADTKRLQSLIGWVPDMPLEQTLADMILEYRSGKART